MSDSGKAVRLLIADDHPALRAGLIAIVSSNSGIEIVGEASDGEEAVRLYGVLQPDILVVDLRMPKLDGLVVVERILAIDPAARILVMTMYDHEEDIFRSVRAGAKGYILKNATRDQILNAIEMVSAGGIYLPDFVGLKLASHMSTPSLTSRERDVLGFVQLGLSNKEIAQKLGLTEGTVKSHLREVMSKLDAISRTEAVNIAIQRGVLKP